MKLINQPPIPYPQVPSSPDQSSGRGGGAPLTAEQARSENLEFEAATAATIDHLVPAGTTPPVPRAGAPALDSKMAGLALSGKGKATFVSMRGGNPLTRPALSKEEVERNRADRKLAIKAAAIARANTPPTPAQIKARRMAEQSAAEKLNVDHILDEKLEKDVAERTISQMPVGGLEISDGKIYKYAYNASGKVSSGKALGFESLGYKIKDGGFDPPVPPEIKTQGDHLRQEIIDATTKGPVVMRLTTQENIERNGIYYNATIPINGIGAKSGKQATLVTGWVDKRQTDGSTRGIAELATLIPKGEKK